MLELKNITKVYPAGGEEVRALKGINLQFRNSEFVSILGPSGCGKTTMLNIIGGLDQYTSGDLSINGRSTRNYKNRDWDTYRNHSVGFVFQSYNLIPHQTVLQNVELALTLSGVSKRERRKRAKEALARVGLSSQLRKKPAEMSGGQMQRVAIARAIVNDPDIILADEPTGALDTETSVQVMEILKEISKDRLVVMVTHNPDLAYQYSTRIVRMLDGEIQSDSAPLSLAEAAKERALDAAAALNMEKRKMPSMSIWTSFSLSLKNLFTKKGRTALTGFAGSIGIIGIALIYAVSQGMTNYIDVVQEQTLSSYPLTIEKTNTDVTSLLETFMGKAESEETHENDAVYQKAMLYKLLDSMSNLEEKDNDLEAFRNYIEEQRADENSPLHTALSAVQYSYDIDLKIYTENVDGDIILSDTTEIMRDMMKQYFGMNMSASSSMSGSMFGSTMMSGSRGLWKELIPGDKGELISDVTQSQYQLLYGSWPQSYDEVILFVDEDNELNDLTLYALGLKSKEDIDELSRAAANKETVEYDGQKWSYEELCNMTFRTILNSDAYSYDQESGTYTDLRETDTGLRYLFDNGLELKVTGIAKVADDAVSSNESGSIGYTYKLTEYVIEHAQESVPVMAQKESPETDIFTGMSFKPEEDSMNTAEKAEYFRNAMKELEDSEKASMYISIMSVPEESFVNDQVDVTLGSMSREEMEAALLQAMSQQAGMDAETMQEYVAGLSDEEMQDLFRQMLEEQIRQQYAVSMMEQTAMMTEEEQSAALDDVLADTSDERCAELYEEVLEFSDSTYEDNLIELGCVDLSVPSAINLYATTFADKDIIEAEIDNYNEGVDDLQEIQYTDYVGLIMSSVTTIINAITYVLIAFVSVSLIVSSIMIGVITLISVQERTKEIGILRAIGASKRNVSGMFNAETLIIGLLSGIIGVGITYLLCIPINIILHKVTGINNLSAELPVSVAVILILISMMLTLFAGIIPSRSAAKKEPVVALRTE